MNIQKSQIKVNRNRLFYIFFRDHEDNHFWVFFYFFLCFPSLTTLFPCHDVVVGEVREEKTKSLTSFSQNLWLDRGKTLGNEGVGLRVWIIPLYFFLSFLPRIKCRGWWREIQWTETAVGKVGGWFTVHLCYILPYIAFLLLRLSPLLFSPDYEG